MADNEHKIYVGNLPYSIGNDELADLFQKFKPVSADVITDRDTGRSKGFGFVVLNSQDDVKDACDEMNGYECNDRTLKVSVANSRRDGGGGGGFRSGGGGGFRGRGGGRGGRGYNDRRYDGGGGRRGGGGRYGGGSGGGYGGGGSYSSGGGYGGSGGGGNYYDNNYSGDRDW